MSGLIEVEIIVDDPRIKRIERREFEVCNSDIEVAVRADVLTKDFTEETNN